MGREGEVKGRGEVRGEKREENERRERESGGVWSKKGDRGESEKSERRQWKAKIEGEIVRGERSEYGGRDEREGREGVREIEEKSSKRERR